MIRYTKLESYSSKAYFVKYVSDKFEITFAVDKNMYEAKHFGALLQVDLYWKSSVNRFNNFGNTGQTYYLETDNDLLLVKQVSWRS